MNVSTFISIVKSRLKRRTDNLDADIQRELSVCQGRLEHGDFLPWFLLSEGAEADCVAQERRLPVPTTFLMEYEGSGIPGALQIEADPTDTQNSWYFLRKGDHGDLLSRYPGRGKPKRYDLSGQYFRLYPEPDQIYTFRMFFYKADTDLSGAAGTDTNLWLTHAGEWLIQEVMTVMALQHLDMPEEGAIAAGLAREAKTELYNFHVAREEQNKLTVFGGET